MGWSAFRPTGLTHHNSQLSAKGYTFFSPGGLDDAYLLDMSGRIVGHWSFTALHPSFVQFLPNGNLLVVGNDQEKSAAFRAADEATVAKNLELHVKRLGGAFDIARELDWDGNVVWELRRPFMHHDFQATDTGTFLTVEYAPLDQELSRQVRGGIRSREKIPMLGDVVVELDQAGKELSRLPLWPFFDPRRDPINPMLTRREWHHANSVDLTPEGHLLVSSRHNSRVVMIDRENEVLLWKSKPNQFSLQHHATSVPQGRIQVFDNGEKRFNSLTYSRLVEVDPQTDEETWSYVARPMSQFYTGHMGAAQRLALANVLITEGVTGRIFEISRQGEVVWEWISPFMSGSPDGNIRNWLYRTYRYPVNHAAFVDKDLDPERFAKLNVMYGLTP